MVGLKAFFLKSNSEASRKEDMTFFIYIYYLLLVKVTLLESKFQDIEKNMVISRLHQVTLLNHIM